MTKLKFLLMIGVVAMLTLAIVPAQAQDEIVLVLSAPEFSEEVYRQVADDFEAQNPGVRVYLDTYAGLGSTISTGGDAESYLDDFEDLVSSADVVTIGNSLLPEATRAGYLLDLAPLVNSDSSLNIPDFFPSIWNSFQWDGGIWGIPISGQAITIYYDPVAFDEAGVPYPNENWTITDFDSAVRSLTQYDDAGNVSIPGFLNLGGDLSMLFASMLGQGIYNDGVFPSVPNYDNAELENLLTIWANLEADGVVNFPAVEEFDFNTVPMLMGASFLAGGGAVTFTTGGGDDTNNPPPERVPTLLPGGSVGLDVNGYGVSSGSQNPELAYELAKFISNSPEIVSSFFGDTPARRSLIGVEGDTGGPGNGPRIILESITSEEIELFLQSSLDVAMPVSELRFMTQITDAIASMNSDGLDAATALDDLEVSVLERLQVADERATITQIAITPPPEATVLSAGEIALNFGLNGFIANEDQWQEFATEFAVNDPEIGAIIVDSVQGRGNNLTTMTETYDCFYQGTNLVPNADLSLLRNIDPLISTDFNFNLDDIVTGALEQVQLNGQTWAYPLTIQPLIMRVNPDLFAQAGASLPNGTWSVDQFEDALRALDSFLGEDEYAFTPQAFDNAYLLNLIASYGGIPVDSRTNPTTYNFTDPANVEAIRQVLDLAVNGFMEYNELASVGGAFNFVIGGGEDGVALYTESLGGGFGGGGLIFAGGGDFELPENTDIMTTFPTGNQFNAISYDLGAAYISATTQYPEACYRFISALSLNTELFTSMPARRSLINSQELMEAQGQNAVNFYNSMDALLSQSNTIVLPTFNGGGGINLDTFWLNRIFDEYVAGEILDLEEALAEAEAFTLAYQECTANIQPFDPASGINPQQFFGQLTDCAVQIDPTAESFFPNFGN